jgi:hypothetical protein
MMFGIVLQVLSGLVSPVIFVPGLVVGWFARRWWLVPVGGVLIAVVSQAEIMLIELPGAKPDWPREPVAVVAPLAWCAAGFLLGVWHRRTQRLRPEARIKAWPIVTGMTLGAALVGLLAVGVGVFYLREGQLAYHTVHFGREAGSPDYEMVFLQYLIPGVLLGQLAGGLIGRLIGRSIAPDSPATG